MASNRKKKKAEKAAEKANGKPNTSVADAMTKAKGKQQAKPVGKPADKIIKGFGSKTKGAVIHAVTSINNAALCDTKIADIEILDYLIPKDVTCKKCQRYAAFKLAFENHKPKINDQKPTKKAEVKTKKATKETVAKAKEKLNQEEVEADEQIDSTMENLKGLISFKLIKMEKRIIKKLEKYCETILDARPMFFIVRKANNMYEIIHDASRYVICDNVKESDAEELLVKYLEISPKWDGQTKPSKEWLSALRKIHEKHFPKKVVDKAKIRTLKRRPRPSIKRRKDRKPEKRVIKRRSK